LDIISSKTTSSSSSSSSKDIGTTNKSSISNTDICTTNKSTSASNNDINISTTSSTLPIITTKETEENENFPVGEEIANFEPDDSLSISSLVTNSNNGGDESSDINALYLNAKKAQTEITNYFMDHDGLTKRKYIIANDVYFVSTAQTDKTHLWSMKMRFQSPLQKQYLSKWLPFSKVQKLFFFCIVVVI